MKKEVRNLKFNKLSPLNLVYYLDYSTGKGIPTMRCTAIEIEKKYYYLELPSGRKCYTFNVSLKSSNRINDSETIKHLKINIKCLLSKEFNFENIFKKELIIINF